MSYDPEWDEVRIVTAQSTQQSRHTVEFRLQPKPCMLYNFLNESKSYCFLVENHVSFIFDKMARARGVIFFLVHVYRWQRTRGLSYFIIICQFPPRWGRPNETGGQITPFSPSESPVRAPARAVTLCPYAEWCTLSVTGIAYGPGSDSGRRRPCPLSSLSAIGNFKLSDKMRP